MQLVVRLRDLPARLGRRPRRVIPPAPEALTSEQYRQAFLPVDEEPGMEFVIRMIGKFMSPTQMEFRRFDPPQFAGFGEPGYGKVATSFLVLPYGTGRSLLCTETRTATTDPDSARQFRRYWKIIGPFAGYIMRHWLTLAKQHAVQGRWCRAPAGPPARSWLTDSGRPGVSVVSHGRAAVAGPQVDHLGCYGDESSSSDDTEDDVTG